MEWYRSGHNEAVSKTVSRKQRPAGSNPAHSANTYKKKRFKTIISKFILNLFYLWFYNKCWGG